MENIKVLRRQELKTREVMVGDQILVSLAEIGGFTATQPRRAFLGRISLMRTAVAIRTATTRRPLLGFVRSSGWLDE